MTSPVISVVMSVYNGEPYLSQAIESILQQTFQDFEFIIINDGSTDSSFETIQNYADKDLRIVPITQENIGLTRSLNIGIQLADGQFIARQDADDLSVPTRFEKQLPWVLEHGYDLCCSRTWLINEKRVTPNWGYWLPKKFLLLKYNPFIHGTFLFKKECLNYLNGYNERYLFGQDYELIIRFLSMKFKFKYLKESLYNTQKLSTAISTSKKKEQQEFGDEIRNIWVKKVIHDPSIIF